MIQAGLGRFFKGKREVCIVPSYLPVNQLQYNANFLLAVNRKRGSPFYRKFFIWRSNDFPAIFVE